MSSSYTHSDSTLSRTAPYKYNVGGENPNYTRPTEARVSSDQSHIHSAFKALGKEFNTESDKRISSEIWGCLGSQASELTHRHRLDHRILDPITLISIDPNYDAESDRLSVQMVAVYDRPDENSQRMGVPSRHSHLTLTGPATSICFSDFRRARGPFPW